MARSASQLRAAATFLQCTVGEIAAVDPEGRPFVRFPGGGSEPVRARSSVASSSMAGEPSDAAVGSPVLLVFENGDVALPIVVGFVRDRLHAEPQPLQLKLDAEQGRDVLVDGRRLVLDAQQEIVLRCGQSTISLQRDGRVLIRGAHLVSRSSGPNKIKGGSISLN